MSDWREKVEYTVDYDGSGRVYFQVDGRDLVSLEVWQDGTAHVTVWADHPEEVAEVLVGPTEAWRGEVDLHTFVDALLEPTDIGPDTVEEARGLK